MRKDKIKAIKTARFWLKEDRVYLDTETTGLGHGAEVVDIAVIGADGERLLDTLVRPTVPIPEEATKIHGITDEDVSDAPSFSDIMPNLKAMLEDRLIIVYNADYDVRILHQSATINNEEILKLNAVCAMKLYSVYYGDWNARFGSYRWQSQEKAARQLGIEVPADLHRAAADAALCRLIVEAMAKTPLPDEEEELAVELLKKTARHWPKSLWLLSADGSLYVMKRENDRREIIAGRVINNSFVLAEIDIETERGDP